MWRGTIDLSGSVVLRTNTLNLVNTSSFDFASLLVGLVIGSIAILLANRFIRSRTTQETEIGQSLSDGAAELLELLSYAALVLNPQNVVVRATQGALAFGLIRDRTLIHDELHRLADRARRSKEIEFLDTELVIGLRRQTAFIHAKALALGDGNILVITEDRTEAKRLDETRRDFIANISHELKTPIGAVSLLAETIADAKDDPVAVSKFAKSLSREAKRLTALIKDVIQLSKFQATDLVGQADLVDLSQVVLEAVDRNQFLAEQKEVTVNYDAPEGIEVMGDTEMLTVALKNLIENAIIYSDAGTSVGVGIKESNGIAAVSVTDQGIGLSEDDQKRVFERFYRVDPSRSRETGGTGLGLSIVKHVALTHQGEIRVFSKQGVGSTFTLRLPSADTKIVVSEAERIRQ